MQSKSDSTFEKFPSKKKKPSDTSDKETRFKERDNKRKQKTQSRSYTQES